MKKHLTTFVLLAIVGGAAAFYALDNARSAPTTQPVAQDSPTTRPLAEATTQPLAAATTRPLAGAATRPGDAPVAAAPSTQPAGVALAQAGGRGNQNNGNQGNQNNNQFGNNQNNNQTDNQFGGGRRNRRNGNFGNGGNLDNGATTNPAAGADNLMIAYPTAMPADVDQVVGSRNIFMRGRQNVGGGQRIYGNGPPRAAGQTLVFIGADDTDNILTAYIENMDTEAVNQYRIGTSLDGGKITGISLDTLEFTVGAQINHIVLGQTLSGASAYDLVYGLVPTTPVTSTDASSGAGSDVLARMKLRRQAEMAVIAGVKTIPGDAGAATQASPAAATPGAGAPTGGATTSPTGGAR
jgi:hypothetical protein